MEWYGMEEGNCNMHRQLGKIDLCENNWLDLPLPGRILPVLR